MSLATMAGRTLPLADSVRDAILAAMKANRWTPSDEDAFWATTDKLLADVAAADRLARAAETLDRTTRAPMGSRLIGKLPAAIVDRREALDDYRARMAPEASDARP